MARPFVYSITLDGGLVEQVALDTLAADDLPRVLPNPAGGYGAPYLVIDQYGRVTAASASTAALTDAANTFTLGQTITFGSGVGLTIKATTTGLFGFRLKDASNNTTFQLDCDTGTIDAQLIQASVGFRVTAFGAYVGVLSGDRFEFQNGRIDCFITSSTGLQVRQDDAATATASDALVLRHNTSGTAGAGYGSNLRFQLESSTTSDRNAANVAATWIDATDATRTGRLSLGAYYTSTFQEGVRVDAGAGGVTVSLADGTASFASDGSASFGSGALTIDATGFLTGPTGQWGIGPDGAGAFGGGRLSFDVSGNITATSVGTTGALTVGISNVVLNADGSASFANGAVEVRASGTIKPFSMADASAESDSIYFSTTASKLVYKDSGGTVRALY